LITGAYFFAMRSCEYSHVERRGRTKLLRVQDIVFSDISCRAIDPRDHHLMSQAEYVTVTFQNQKNNKKFEQRTQQRTNDPVLCPVQSWRIIIQQILSSPGTSMSTPVNFYYQVHKKSPRGIIKSLSQADTNFFLRSTISHHPPNYFNYGTAKIGSHSIRSGAAMALFLNGDSPHKIMILGRWSSDAFLVQFDDFHVAPDISAFQNPNFRRHHDDPCIPGDPRNSYSIPHFHGHPSSVLMPKIHLFA
jgi:hypothetical protein